MNQQNRSPLEDRRVRLALAALLAIFMWVAVTTVVQPGTTVTLNNVPVDYTYDSSVYTSRGLSIVDAPERTVNLTVSGDGYTIGGLTSAVAGNISVAIANTNSTVDIVFDIVEEKTLPIQVNTRYLTI